MSAGSLGMIRKYHFTYRPVFKKGTFFAGMLLVLFCFTTGAEAQSTSQVTIVGIPPVLPSPYADDIETNFVTGQYQIIFNYTSFSNAAADFVFGFEVLKDNRQVVHVESMAESFTPGTYIFTSFFEDLFFPQGANDLFSQLDGDIQNQIVQTGTLPEANYTIRVTARPVSRPDIVQIAGNAHFSVRYPSPPVLVSPANGSDIMMDIPIFAWTPVVNTMGLQMEYEFLLVEVLTGQSPLQAINSNREITSQTLIGNTTLPYTFEYLPLEEDTEYAWRITAKDALGNVPLQNEGQTEIYTFTFKPSGDHEEDLIADFSLLEEIPLIPQFAMLTGLETLSVSEMPATYELNGPATLELEMEPYGSVQLPVTVSGLNVQKASLSNPVLAGGSVSGAADALSVMLHDENPWIEVEELFWSFGQNVRVSASLRVPGEASAAAAGDLTLTPNGLSGTIQVSGSPLAEFTHDLLEIGLTSLNVSFPGNETRATGTAHLAGIETPCVLSDFQRVDPEITIHILCSDPSRIQLVEASDLLIMDIDRITGAFVLDAQAGISGYDMELRTFMGLKTANEHYCGNRTRLMMNHEEGLTILGSQQNCPEFNPEIDLGFARLQLERIQLEEVSYDPSAEEWDFELLLDTILKVEAFDSWTSLTMTDILVNREGVTFSEISFHEDSFLNPLPDFDADLFRIVLREFGIGPFTFPWFDWDGQGPGPWSIHFEGDASIRPVFGAPQCLLGTSLHLGNGRIGQDQVVSELTLENFDGCEWELAPGMILRIDALSGIAGAEYPPFEPIRPFGEVKIEGGFTPGSPFVCDEAHSFPFTGDDLTLSQGISGTLHDVIPPCPLHVGPFAAQVTESSVIFSLTEAGDQQAIMQAEAVITLESGLDVDGTVEMDLMTGEWLSVSFVMDQPFDWHIPSAEEPLLIFRLEYAEINETGFYVDGRHSLILPDSFMGVTFDNMVFDLENMRVENGQIIFDESFALETGLDTNSGELAFRAVEPGAELTLDPGLLMELAGTVVIDSEGLRLMGAADVATRGNVRFNGKNYHTGVTVEYTEDFRMALYPFGIISGQADFFYENERFAYADPSGFYPVPAFFADLLIPERLPLPSEDIAYLQLREGDELLVNITEDEDGYYIISTLPDRPLALVVPYLDPASPPVLTDIALHDLTITPNPFNPEIISGSVTAHVSPDDPLFNLQNQDIPLTVRRIEYGTRIAGESPFTALYFLGDLHLFDQQLQGDTEVEFYVSGDGYIRASIESENPGSGFSIAPGGQVTMDVNALHGNFEMLIGSANPVYDFSISGTLDILTDQGSQAGADLTIRTQSGGYVSITEFNAAPFIGSPGMGVENFWIGLDEIVSITEFSYSTLNGFEFAIVLNAHLDVGLSGGEELTIALQEIEIRHDGFHIPPQEVNESSIPGFRMPEVDLGGFGFRMLAFRTAEGFAWSWDEDTFDLDFSMDFIAELPEFQGSGLNPPDGLLFTDVGYEDGYLTGSMEPFRPLAVVDVPLSSGEEAPTLIIEEITGALSRVIQNGEYRQKADFIIDGRTGRVPAFVPEDPALCHEGAEFSLAIIEGRAFEGTVTDMQPCGYLNLGPVALEVTSADLYLYLEEGEQIAELDGAVEILLPAGDEQQPVTASGGLVLDLLTGQIRDGSVSIDQPFNLPMPLMESGDPFFTLGIEQALLNSAGLTLTGYGTFETSEVNAGVTYEDLVIGFPSFEIIGGSAVIEADLAVQFTPGPFAIELVASDSPLPDKDVLRMDLNAVVVLDSYGIGISGSSRAHFLFSQNNYTNLRVELSDDFTLSVTGASVARGQAEFYWDQDGQPAPEPIVIVDEYGFHLGTGLIALLPDRLPLPSEDIAWIGLKDEEGNLYVDVQTTDTGYTLSTNGDFVPIVVAAISSDGEPFTAGVQFTLHTDDLFHVTGGELELDSDYSLAGSLNLPVTLTKLALNTGDGLKLEVGLHADLPAIFSDFQADTDATIYATLSASGVESGIVAIGQVTDTVYPELEPLFSFRTSGTTGGVSDTFSADLMGIELAFGASESIRFGGTIQSSLVMDEGDEPLGFISSWEDGEWTFHLNAGDGFNELRLGQALFILDDHDPVTLVADNDHFYLSISGQVSFEDVLEEPVVVSVQDLQVGVANYRTTPSLHFALGGAAGALGDQELRLFDSAVVIALIEPVIALSGRELVMASSGYLHFLGQQIDYEGLQISTSGQFQLDEIAVSDLEIFGEYLILQSFALQMNDGLRVESELALSLPAPVSDYSASGSLQIYRDANGTIVVDETGLLFDVEERFSLLNFGEFELTKVRASVYPFEWNRTAVYANGNIYIDTEPDPVIVFGEASNFPDNAGIGISYSGSGSDVDVLYNITGNPGFDFDHNFFTIAVEADVNTTSGEGFEILLAGRAGISLDGIDADLDYGGIRITEEGLTDYGNITGGSVNVGGIASLSVGQFIYHREDAGFTIDLPDTDARNPEELRGAGEVETNSVQVVELLCFGPCPEAGPAGASYSGPALSLSIGADAGNNTGGISGSVERVMFYRTAAGLRSLTIENAHIEIDNIFEMAAGLTYVQEDGGMLLRAAAAGSFNIGGSHVGAAVAGKFANIGNDVSFGLFVAVESGVGIPIVPGAITLTGAGGGFFYKPVQEDLNIVHSAMAGFGHELVNPEAGSIQGAADFAVMLYASVGIAGGGNTYIVEGTTFFQITSQSFYMDARAFVLGMDGENSVANTKVSGEISGSIQRDPFAMLISVDVDIAVPLVLEGNGSIQFFMNETESQLAWGIIGHTNVSVFGGLLSGGAEFLAGNPGFMLQVNVGFHVDIAIIKIESNVTGAIWAITDPGYQFPFGAYVTFEAEATVLLITISARAQAAFVTRNPAGFELFATVAGCVRIVGSDQCVSAWASVADDGVSFGFGTGAHANLVNQAAAQLDDFRAHILSLMSQIPGAMAAIGLPEPLVISTPEDATEAGFYFYSLQTSSRVAWDKLVNHSDVLQSLPAALQNVNSEVMRSPNPFTQWPGHTAVEQAAQAALDVLSEMDEQITADMITAYELQESAEEHFQQLLSSMSVSPVGNVVKPVPTLNTVQSVDFTVDDGLAGEQIASTEQYKAETGQLEAQFRANIDQVLNSLNEMSDLLQTDVSHERAGHLINMAHWYGEIYEEMERYFALNANKVWNEVNWAFNGLNYMNQNRPAITSAIDQLSTSQQNLITSYFTNPLYVMNTANVPQSMRSELNYLALRLAQRENFIFRFAQGNVAHPGWGALPSPNSNQAPADVQRIYQVFSYPLANSGVNAVMPQIGTIQEINYNYWYTMNVGGLEAYRNSRLPLAFDVIFNNHREYKEQVFGPLRNITQILDEFYTIKSNITTISYNMIEGYLNWRQEAHPENGSGPLPSPIPGPVQGSGPLLSPIPGPALGLGGGSEGVQIELNNRAFNSYEAVKSYLAQQLQPPQITNITAYPNRPATANGDTYYNETGIEWTALHPGGIIESAVNVAYTTNDDTDISVGIDDYLSVGNRNHFTLYPYSRGGSSRNINFGVRVRGPAGNTAMRRASFSVDVAPGGSSSVPPGGSVVPDVIRPPRPPVIDLSSFYTSTNSNIPGGSGTRPNQPGTEGGNNVYWTHQPGTLRLSFTAHDPAVGIGQWEYSIGSRPGSADVLEWTTLQGNVTFHPEIPAHKVTGITSLVTLEPGQQYYISARVRNTLGQLSGVTSLQEPIMLDNEAPSGITFRHQPQIPGTPHGVVDRSYPPVSTVPPFRVTHEDLIKWAESSVPASLSFDQIRATDRQSGFSHIEYLFTDKEAPPVSRFNTGDYLKEYSSSLVYSDPSLYYNKEYFWHVRTVDSAGNVGEIETFGPFRPADSSIPNAGWLQAKEDLHDIKLYIIEPPYDPESDLTGIQFAIGTSPDETAIRPFPQGTEVDFEWNSGHTKYLVDSGGSFPQRYISIPAADLIKVNDPVYIFYRSVNSQGMFSNISATGLINQGTMPPSGPRN